MPSVPSRKCFFFIFTNSAITQTIIIHTNYKFYISISVHIRYKL